MNKIPDSVIKKLGGSKSSTTPFFYLMKELHISFSELCEMPIPTIWVLFDELQTHNQRELKASKRKR